MSRPDDGTDAPLAWQAEARCAEIDPEAWFPEKGRQARDAKGVCDECPVRKQCLELAVNDTWIQYGIWGGKTMVEIRAIRKQRQLDGAEFPEGWDPNE